MAKKEVKTDLWVASQLDECGIQFTPQGSDVKEIHEALSSASKSGTGNAGYPEYTAVVKDFVLVVEDKADTDKQVKLTDKGILDMSVQAVRDYAVNGAYYYAKHIAQKSQFKKVFAIGVSGDAKHHKITPIYVDDREGYMELEPIESFTMFNQERIQEYAQPYRDQPTVLWNGMVAGLVPYAIKGAIWYQGCANRTDGYAYLEKTVSLVRGWRREWGQGDFPYFLVQLAPYKYDSPKGTTLAVIQEAQARVPDRVPNSGYTVINDVGDVNDIHPTDKRTVGTRMADQVLDRVYGKFVRPWKTPVATGMRVEGATVRVSFENANGLKTRDGLAPTEFEIRDVVGEWVPAAARIEGREVVLSAEGVRDPIGVRFAPYNGSTPNLVNGDGLPAGPFRIGRACPLGAAERLANEGGYACVQRYDIPVCCDLRVNAPKTLAARKDVKRVGYLLELQDKSGDTKFAFAEMDAFSADSDKLVLGAGGGRKPVRTPVANLHVFSNVLGVSLTPEASSGFVEFYFCNYSPKVQAEPTGGDAAKYDFNDTPQPDAIAGLGYGCLQVHDLKSKKTVFAFNHFNSASAPCDVGIGSSGKEHPDWTFARNGGEWQARRLSVWVK